MRINPKTWGEDLFNLKKHESHEKTPYVFDKQTVIFWNRIDVRFHKIYSFAPACRQRLVFRDFRCFNLMMFLLFLITLPNFSA